MAEENTAPQPAAAPAAAHAAPSADEMKKKMAGFMGVIAEKAKNIDVQGLTEKAKAVASEVKSKAGEIQAGGKTASEIKPRETMDDAEVSALQAKAKAEIAEELAPQAEILLKDLLIDGEKVEMKFRAAPGGEGSQLVLTDKNVIVFVKGMFGEQLAANVYPVDKISAFKLVAPRGNAAGSLKLVVAGDDDESKFSIETAEAYFKALAVYKRLREPHGKK